MASHLRIWVRDHALVVRPAASFLTCWHAVVPEHAEVAAICHRRWLTAETARPVFPAESMEHLGAPAARWQVSHHRRRARSVAPSESEWSSSLARRTTVTDRCRGVSSSALMSPWYMRQPSFAREAHADVSRPSSMRPAGYRGRRCPGSGRRCTQNRNGRASAITGSRARAGLRASGFFSSPAPSRLPSFSGRAPFPVVGWRARSPLCRPAEVVAASCSNRRSGSRGMARDRQYARRVLSSAGLG